MKLTVRHLIRGKGQHRRMPRPHGAIVGQQFVDCPTCRVETAATIHGNAIRCTEGHLIGGAA